MVVVVDTVSATQLRPRHPEKVNRPDALSPPKPDWIRVRAPTTRGYAETHKIVKENGLVTVCEEAGCPNIGECWDKKLATFMIMGDTCTRACAFCNVKTGMPGALDVLEPEHVAEATFKLGLAHIVITSVDRDDLCADGGAEHFRPNHSRFHPRALPSGHNHRDPDARFPAQGGCAPEALAGQSKTRRVCSITISGNRAVALSERAPGSADYFHSIRLLAAGQGNRSDDLPRKSGIMVGLGEERHDGPTGNGRFALGGCRFPDHRT